MTQGSLFSGIGGFDLAAEWMGWENLFHCEINPFGQKILKHYWPNAKSYEDIKKTDFTEWRGRIDILSGGFPCQPYSQAGKRKGKDDDRHLWPEMLRAIREIQPRWVVGENVRGLTNWNGGVVFDEVQSDLESEGYQVLPFLLPACAVNAPHRRDRIWFVAYREGSGKQGQYVPRPRSRESGGCHSESLFANPDQRGWGAGDKCQHNDLREREIQKDEQEKWHRLRCHFGDGSNDGTPADTHLDGQHRGHGEHEVDPNKSRLNALNDIEPAFVANASGDIGCKRGMYETRRISPERHSRPCGAWASRNNWSNFPTQPPLRSGDDGLPGRLHGITFPKLRNESIKAYGNAVVPQVVYQIFKAIEKTEIEWNKKE